MTASVPLPSDDELRDDARQIIANLPPLNVFRMVATLPDALRPFLQLGSAVLSDPAIDARVREAAILRVAHITGARYEWAQHEQIGRAAGLGDAEIEALRSDDPAAVLDVDAALAARIAEEISRDVRLSDGGLEALLDRYGPSGAASLILCASYYNMVSRFLESTRVEIESEPLLGGKTPAEFASRPSRPPSADSGGNVELARSAVGDLQRLFDLFADSIVIDNTPMGDDNLPEFKGTFRGKRDAVRTIVEYVGAWDEFTYDVDELIEVGDGVVLLGTETGIGKRSRAPMTRDIAQVWTFEDGRIVRIITYPSKAEVLASVGVRR
jgi:alkylhydroperoxidase family enzyme/ketosteroid isomerase-like protein